MPPPFLTATNNAATATDRARDSLAGVSSFVERTRLQTEIARAEAELAKAYALKAVADALQGPLGQALVTAARELKR